MGFTLPRLPAGDFSGLELQLWWQQVVEAIEAQETSQDSIIASLADQLAQIEAAQSTATASYRELARINSYPNPGAGIISATDALNGTATIAVANHTRVYPVEGGIDVPDVPITGGTITGLAYSTLYYVYYDDPTLAVTTPTFLATMTAALAQVGAAAGRHFVGTVTTPASGGGGTTGGGPSPPGGGGTGGALP